MRDKKQKKEQQTEQQKTHIFEIHTMQSDNMTPKNTSQKNQPPTALPVAAKKSATTKKPSQPEQNPFLTQQDNNKSKKDTFAPHKRKESIEKINQTPEDIVAGSKEKKQKPPKKKKKKSHTIMIIVILLFLVAVAAYTFFAAKTHQQSTVTDTSTDKAIQPDVAVNKEVDTDTMTFPNDTTDTDINQQETEQIYVTDLPNYFAIDVESPTVEQDIKNELDRIAENIEQQELITPISFIVTDTNNNPVSFHVFALSANMNVPQDILSSLEEEFELYAYQDGTNGVRFSFVVDAKNPDALQTALRANETSLPKAFDIVLDGYGASATDVIFHESTYQTHLIRYLNLNPQETYSVDYTINDGRLVLATSKNTMRAVIDALKNAQIPKESNANTIY